MASSIASKKLLEGDDPGPKLGYAGPERETTLVDVIVTQVSENGWELKDLLGRSMGRVSALEGAGGSFTIEPDGGAVETMAGINKGPHVSLDAALAAIEERTRGVCRRSPTAARS